MKTVTSFIRISTICALMSCISFGCTRPPESSEASVDDWVIPDWMDATDPLIAERHEDLVKELQAKVDTGRLDEEGYQYELSKVSKQAINEIRDEKLSGLARFIDQEGRRIRLALLDLNDEIQGFIQAKGMHSLWGLQGTPEWNVLEKLSLERLEARIEIRVAEQEIDSKPRPADNSANTQSQMPMRIIELKKRLAAMDAEFDLLDALMRDRCANASTLEHMLRSQLSLEEMREDNQRAISWLRLLQITPSEDEDLLSKILNE